MRKCKVLNGNVFVLFYCYLSLIYMIDSCCMWNGMMVVFLGMYFGFFLYYNNFFVLIVVLVIDINVSCRMCVLIFKKNEIK